MKHQLSENNLYELQYIYGSKIDKEIEQITYCVKWNNFNKSDSTWEPFNNIGIENIQSIRRFQRHSDYNIFYQEILGNKKEIFGSRVHYKNGIQEIIQMILPSQSEPILDKTKEKTHQQTLKQQLELEKKNENYNQDRQLKNLNKTKKHFYLESSESECKQRRRQPKSKQKQQNIIEKQQLQEEGKNKQDSKNQEEDEHKFQSDEKIISQRNLRKKQIEEIQSIGYYNKLKNILNNLDKDETFTINSRINQENKDSSYELLFQMIVYDYEQQVKECLEGLINQYNNEQYKQPNFIVKFEIKPQQKQIKQNQKKKNQISLQSIDGKRTNKKGLLKKNTEDIPSIKDFLINVQEQPYIGIFSVQNDKQFTYGQIGFQKGESIQGHTYGISSSDSKPEINLYFIMEYRRNENGEKPLFNFVTKSECLLYEKDLLLDYVAKNQSVLPDLYDELIR